MKTFTNYAEKKAKQFLNLLQGYTRGIRITAILILLLMGVSNAWAYDIKCTFIYDNSKTQWSSVQLMVGYNTWSQGYVMTKIANTQLWYYTFSNNWGGATHICVFNASSAWGGEGNSVSHRSGYMDQNTEVKALSGNMTDGIQLITTTSDSDGTAMSTSYHSSYTGLNTTQTATVQSTTDGSTYSDNSNAGSVSISTYKLKSTSASESSTGTTSASAARTAVVTMTATAKTGYTFVDWCNSSNTQQTTSETLTYTCSGSTATYKARFEANQYTVKFDANGGTGSMSNQSHTYSVSQALTANAFTRTGYTFEGWNTNANGTGTSYTDEQSVSNLSSTDGATITLYAQWAEIPANNHNITYTAQATGWTYGANNPTSAEEGATVTFVVNPTAGYRVSVTSIDVTLNKNGNNYTFTMPNKDVEITVDAKPEQYNVTLNKQSGTGGTSSVTATYLAVMPDIIVPTRTGYTFNGYFDATSSGKKYYGTDGKSANYWDKTSNTTLYAQWTANTYTITYKDQGGSDFSGVHASGHPTTHTYGTATTLKDATKTGYTFDGWFTTSACTETAITSLGATDYTSNITLYAKWTELPPTTVYFKPINDWKGDNTRFAVYYWEGNTNGWIDMIEEGCTGEFYKADIPARFTNIKFVSFPTDKENNWDYDINRTEDLEVPNDGKVLYDMASTNITHLYLKPNDNWKNNSPRNSAYFYGNGEKWVDMEKTKIGDDENFYKVTIQVGYPNVIFCSMNKNTTGNSWGDKWNQTGDLTIPADGKNLFTLPADSWDGATTSWSTIYDNSKWTTYTVPTYTITINAPEAGSIAVTVGGNTTTVTNTPKQITNIAAGTTFTIEYTPNAGFELGHSEVEGIKEAYNGAGTYTVCGPVDITAHFVTEENQVVYLRPNGNWLADSALFYAYAFNRYGDNEWIELITEKTDYTGAYGCTIPAGYSDVIFVRINPTAAEPSWNDGVKWNQSVDYVIPVNTTTNRFIIGEKVISGEDEGKYQGSWEASDTPIYGIPGDWQGTDTWAADEYPLMGPDGLVTVNITQTNDTLGFKVYRYPYGTDENSYKWLGNNGTMVRGGGAVHEGGWTMETNTDDCGLAVDVAGDYVFHFNIRESKLTVQYPPMPVPSTITLSAQRIFEDAPLDWIAGNGTEADPYQLYVDETARLTVTGLADVLGLTTYYRVGDNEEQTSNIIDFTNILTEDTAYTVYAYYKNAAGATSDTVTVQTPYIKGLPMPFYLMTSPSQEINIDRIAAGENILVQFRSDAAATVSLYLQINDGEERELPVEITNSISKDYTHDVDDNIEPCILHYIARSAATVHGRTFEAKADVAIYKNVIIKVNDPEGWVKNAYMWRDYSDAVKTQWPGEPVLQNYGTWRVFSVKYPYYDRFIVNDGNAGNSTQTIDWELPADDTCYELLVPANNGSADPADANKYGLQVAECPENLLVEDIKDTTITEGEQIVVMPKIFVGLGYQVADIEASVHYDNNGSIKAMMSGTNVTILGNAEGESNVTVTYILDDIRIEKTFKVTVTKRTKITIQVKVPKEGTSGAVGWTNHDGVYLRYWHTGDGTNLLMTYLKDVGDYDYYEADVPLDANGETNFHLFYEEIDDNNRWRQTINKTIVKEDGCYLVTQDGGNYYRGLEDDGVRCLTDQYQVRIAMGSGKTYSSNIVTAEEDTLSFFAPGMNETGYKAGVIMLYQNDKMIATIEPSTFAVSNVYTATLNDALNGLDNVSTYSGNFYIRTWGTDGDIDNKGWKSVQDWNDSEKASRTFTEFVSREGEFYNHYWVQAMNSGNYDGKDVSACVANDYNDDLAGKLLQDKNTNEYGDIKVGTGKVINVRFGYDPRTNYFGRAVLQGSEYESYLNLHCDNAYADKECTKKLPYGNNTNNDGNKFRDVSNWVYERDVYVNITNGTPSASLYVEAKSPRTDATVYNHLLGYGINEVTGEETSTPIQKTVIGSGTDNGVYKVRVVYDFKTNRIIAVWEIATDLTITTDKTVNADVLFIRKENEDVPQITLSDNGEINNLKSLFFAMELHRDYTNQRHEEQYMFTLPFDCVVGSISGLHGYMELWGLQRYRGDLRAQKGWYAETATFWEWLTPKDTLKAGEGYLLAFDKKNAPWNEIEVDKKDANGNIIEGQKEIISMIRLYFPSIGSGFDLQQQSAEQLTRTYENHTCTLTLHDRYKYDSNWKMIGTTSYNNATVSGYTKDDDPKYEELTEAPSFRYRYSYTFDNNNNRTSYDYEPEDGKTETYKSFYGYMVQFAGTITWNPINETVPEPLAAPRRAQAERSSVTMRLELANTDGEKQDQTFVALDEKGTTTFDQNLDLNKIFNSGKANVYTLSEGIPFAGNTLPMGEAIVPVGVQIATEGEYTFRMPDGTEGMMVELVDYETSLRYNLLYAEPTFFLEKGTEENRFALHIQPQKDVVTGVGNVGDEAKGDKVKGIEKYLIDGKLIIRTAEGAVYDAQGHVVQ